MTTTEVTDARRRAEKAARESLAAGGARTLDAALDVAYAEEGIGSPDDYAPLGGDFSAVTSEGR